MNSLNRFLWNSEKISEQVSERFVLSDHPQEPNTCFFEIRLKPDSIPELLSLDKCLIATEKLFSSFPTLRKHYELNVDKTKVILDTTAFGELAQKVWSRNRLTQDDFRNSPISATEAPLFYFRYENGLGLEIAIHHSLADGRSAYLVLITFLKFLCDEATNLEAEAFPKIKYKTDAISLGKELLETLKNRKSKPPAFIKSSEEIFGSRHHFRHHCFLKNNITIDKKWGPLILSCFAKALAEMVSSLEKTSDSDYLSIMVPVDLCEKKTRSYAIGNYSLNAKIKFDLKKLLQERLLVSEIEEKMNVIRHSGPGITPLLQIGITEWAGLMNKARSKKFNTGLPLRSQETRNTFWKSLDTAVFSNLGYISVPDFLSPAFNGHCGFTPVIPPMGFSLAVAVDDHGYHLCLRWSDASLNESQGNILFDRIVSLASEYVTNEWGSHDNTQQRRSPALPAKFL